MHPLLHCLLLAGISLIPLFINLFRPNFPNYIKYIIIAGAFILTYIIYYNQFYKPFKRKNKEYLDKILGELFYALDKKLKEAKPELNNLRINVMIAKRKFFQFWKRYLKIDFYYGDYLPAEMELEFINSQGCCGTALNDNAQYHYDADSHHQALKGMSGTQKKVTEHLGSILSTPIYYPKDEGKNRPLAILNLDSIQHYDETGFNTTTVQDIAAKFATLIGGQL